MGLLSTRSRHSCSVTCSWLTPFWETEFGTSARDQFGAMVSRPPDVYWVSTDAAVWRTVQTTAAFPRPIRETEWGEGLLWQMHRKVDRCQHAQRGEKGYGTQIG